MSIPTVLVNYRIGEDIKGEFERYCRQRHISMTTQINLLMREFIAKQRLKQNSYSDDDSIAFFASWEDRQ